MTRLDGKQRFEYQGDEVTEKYHCVSVNPETTLSQLDKVCSTWCLQSSNFEETKHQGSAYKKDRSYRGSYGTPVFNVGVLLKYTSFTGTKRKKTPIQVIYNDRHQLCMPGHKAPVSKVFGELPTGMWAHNVKYLTAIQEQQHEEILKDVRAYEWVREHLVDKNNLYSLKLNCRAEEDFKKAYPNLDMNFYEWYQLNHVYFLDKTAGVVIYFANPEYLTVRTFVPRIGQTTLTHRLYKIRNMSEVKKDVLWRLELTSEENLECRAHLRKREDLEHTNWIPIFHTRFKLQKNSVLQLEVDGWQNEKRTLTGVTFSEANEQNRDWFMKLEWTDLGRVFSNRLILPFSFREKTTS